MTALPAEAEEFLRRLRAALAPLPPEERDDVVAEVRGHLAERPPAGPEALREAFGAPEDYAASFVAAHALSGALAQGTSWALARALLVGARDTLLGLAAVSAVLLAQLLALALVVAGALRPFLPDRVGLFVDASGRFHGLGLRGGDLAGLHEVLGWWAMPAFLLPGLLVLWLGNRALRALARRWLARRSTPA